MIVNDRFEVKRLISTILLRELIDVIEALNEIVKLAKQLDYNAVIIVGITLRKKAPDTHWVYVPEHNIVFHKYAWISNYSPYNAPDEMLSSLLIEITIRRKK